jgi:hypothetical protein
MPFTIRRKRKNGEERKKNNAPAIKMAIKNPCFG